VSLSRQTTNQMLKELERKGIISLKFGQLTILDMARLRDAAAESSPYA